MYVQIFESSPQTVLQIVYLTKARGSDVDGLVFSSLLFSLVSVAGRFISDEKVFYNSKAGELSFGFNKYLCGGWGLQWNNGYIIRYLCIYIYIISW